MGADTQQPKRVTATGAVVAGANRVLAVVLTPAAALSTLILYDGTDNTGTKLIELQAAASGNSVSVFDLNIPVVKGVYATLSGASAVAYVYVG